MVRHERRRALGSVFASLVLVASLLVLAGGVFTPVGAEPQSPSPQAWVLVDADSGAVIDGANFHVPLRPASTTKIMTAVTAVERLDPDTPVPVSPNAAGQPPSKMGISAGEEWPLADALAGMLLESSNDLAYALAEAVGNGDLSTWETIVNDTASDLGMVDSHFNDPAGFDSQGQAYSSGPMVSAFDIAIATRNAMAVPALAAIAAAYSYDFTWPGSDAPDTMVNHNKFVPGGERAYADATGFKTGYTDEAGHTLVATAQRDGRELIAVVIDTYDMYGWAAQFLDAGFATDPATAGTGEALPEVAVQPFSQRRDDLDAFVTLARGSSIDDPDDADGAIAAPAGLESQAGDETSSTTAATSAPTTSTIPSAVDEGGASEASQADGASSPEPASTGSSGLPTTWIVLAAIVVLGAAFVLRRRQIVMRKRRRAARRRATNQAMRRGTLPVADGRPVVATRASSPRREQVTDSHVKIVPMIKTERRYGSPASPTPGASTTRRNRPRRVTEQDRPRPR